MNVLDIINEKRRGQALSEEEIAFLVNGYTAGDIPDYQVSAFLMAVCLQGMTDEETAALTFTMRDSGKIMDLSAIPGTKVDKHSTGGVGDKTTISLIPIAAAAGVPCAKLSGRGLGFTGGTLDKLECFPGFRTDLSDEEFTGQVQAIGAAISGQTDDLTPADRKLYALRDASGTVESIPLIASSIMSKKLASGADRIVLDVKTGSGAFMKTEEDSVRLAKTMMALGKIAGHRVSCFITDMNEPLGNAVGNVYEVIEAVDLLKGKGPADYRELVLALAGEMIFEGGCAGTAAEGREKALKTIEDGSALEELCRIADAQGSDRKYVLDTGLLTRAKKEAVFEAPAPGYINGIDAELMGRAEAALGGGRERKEDPIDLSVGLTLLKKMGDRVEAGEPLCRIHYNDEGKRTEALERIRAAYRIGPDSPGKKQVIVRRPEDFG